MSQTTRRAARTRRHRRLRTRLEGTPERPRLAVFRSNAHIYAQVIDDLRGHTLVSASTLEDDLPASDDGKTGAAKQVGLLLAQRATGAGVAKVVFDRGGNRFHGRVEAVADGAREGGLQF